MKQFALILFFLTGFLCSAKAQYMVTYPAPPANTVRCKIVPTTATTWTDQDLITWIFPDGQILQSTISFSNSTMSGDVVDWMPSRGISGEQATAIVTKKGGTGDPSLTITETTFHPTYSGAPNALASIPFAINEHWQLNYTWDFSPGYYTYLVLSYKSGPICSFDSTSIFEITLPPEVTLIDSRQFNLENVSQNGPLLITKLNTNSVQKHILLKVAVGASVPVGKPFRIQVKNNTCSPDGKTLFLTAKTVPHDPNQKTVDIKRICDKNKSTKLHYRVQFHNDGKAPVKKVQVTDCLPGELIPSTFVLHQPPNMNGLTYPTPSTSTPLNEPCKTIVFDGLGMPGLGQNNHAYLYSQTIYAFEFDVMTTANLTKDIDNVAVITFFDDAPNLSSTIYTPLDPITTNVERVYVGCEKPGFCHCLRLLFCRKRNRPKT